MKSRLAGKLGIWLFAGSLISFSLAACGETADCKNLRDTTYANKRTWDACSTNDDCIVVGGNLKDCTGVLTCNFAVNRRYRDLAEQAVYKIGEQSQGCFLCATPSCLEGEIPYCEPVSQRCIVIAQLLDDGGIVQGPSEGGTSRDAGELPDTSTDVDTGTGDASFP